MDGLGSISPTAIAALSTRLSNEKVATQMAISAVKRANEVQELALDVLLSALSPSAPGVGGHVDVLA